MNDLSAVAQRFVLHWGEMGTRWGINRTVAQVHALLFLSETPLPAETIAETLGIARSNASNSLRELQNWGLVRIVHLLGDRRDHFEALQDSLSMLRVILRERKKREIDPTVKVLRECVEQAAKPRSADPHTRSQLSDLLSVFDVGSTAYDQLQKLPAPAVFKLARLGDKALKLAGIATK